MNSNRWLPTCVDVSFTCFMAAGMENYMTGAPVRGVGDPLGKLPNPVKTRNCRETEGIYSNGIGDTHMRGVSSVLAVGIRHKQMSLVHCKYGRGLRTTAQFPA